MNFNMKQKQRSWLVRPSHRHIPSMYLKQRLYTIFTLHFKMPSAFSSGKEMYLHRLVRSSLPLPAFFCVFYNVS